MRKIVSLFKRNYYTDRLVRDEVVPGSEWVIEGDGIATRKLDGTACIVMNGSLWKRYDAKKGRTPPREFVPAQEGPDVETGHWPGWIPIGPTDYWHQEAFGNLNGNMVELQTYELIGPKVQGNPEKSAAHVLIPHGVGCGVLSDAPRDFNSLREWFRGRDIEGVVWHRGDGSMVKIKKRDFGLRRDE